MKSNSVAPALEAALAANRALTAEEWPPGVRIAARWGIHTGEAERRAADYYGPSVNLAALVRAQAHAGEILLSSVTSELVLDGVRLPAAAVLPEVRGLKGPLSCLNEARYGIVWGAEGAARACFESALEYAKERIVFEKPIAGYQLTQQKLAEMALEINRGTLVALHLGLPREAPLSVTGGHSCEGSCEHPSGLSPVRRTGRPTADESRVGRSLGAPATSATSPGERITLGTAPNASLSLAGSAPSTRTRLRWPTPRNTGLPPRCSPATWRAPTAWRRRCAWAWCGSTPG